MSLPAPAGTTVSSFRAGLARGAAAAVPAVRRWAGQGVPGEYRSAFPPRLRAARAAVVVLALLWLAAGFHAVERTGAVVRAVGHDTAPSVSAAEAIRTGLAAANADFALSTLANEGADGAFLSSMRLRLRAVRTAVVEAAGNVTYGDEERGPIRTLLQGLGEYEQTVGRSVASAGDARRDLAFAADDLLHWTVLPAAETLERVNADHLDEEDRAYADGHVAVWAAVAAAALLLLLAAVQVDMARTAKRLLNPGLLLATAAVVAATALLMWRVLAAQTDLHVAKSDAFDSVYALSSAGALAADYDAGESFMLLAADDAARRSRYAAANDVRARSLLGTEPGLPSDAVRDATGYLGHNGYLGDELANVTFEGERDAAEGAVKAWSLVLRADATFSADIARSDRAAALAAKTANMSGSARTAFARFDAALAKVVDINRDAFASSIAAAEGDDAPLGAALVGGFVLAVAAAWFGIGRRLDEYRF